MHAIADAFVEERVGGVWCRAASGRENDVGVLEGATQLGGLRDARAAVAQPRLLGAAERRHRHASEARRWMVRREHLNRLREVRQRSARDILDALRVAADVEEQVDVALVHRGDHVGRVRPAARVVRHAHV